MSRLLIHVEGQTEEAFVNEVLEGHLLACGYRAVAARIVGNARLRRRRGGIRPWPSVRKDIVNHLKEDSGCIATTMVDYYGLPQRGAGSWPGRANAAGLEVSKKAAVVEDELLKDVARQIDNPRRFVPFVLMHEFESLLFSDCDALSRGIGRPDLQPKFEDVRQQFATPEEINDSPDTAPSKRMESIIPGYEKPLLLPWRSDCFASGRSAPTLTAGYRYLNLWRLDEWRNSLNWAVFLAESGLSAAPVVCFARPRGPLAQL